jgi:hypothetical protein
MKRIFLIGCISVLIVAGMFSGCGISKEYDYDRYIYIDERSVSLYYGDEKQVVASPSYERNDIKWTSEDPSIATVSASGLIKATGVGETIIVASLGEDRTELPVTVTIPTADKVTGRPGNKRAALELEISNDRVKAIKITRLDNDQSQEADVNFQSGTVTVYYTGLTEGRYNFRVVCIDQYDNESVPVDLNIQVYGDIYQSTLTVRPVSVVTKFGNGYAIGLGVTSCMYSELFYTNLQGEAITKKIPVQVQSLYLYDYDGSGLSQIAYYLPESTAVDTFKTAKITYSGSVNDRATVITSSDVTYVRPGDFDLGGEGVGFHDSNSDHDPGSSGANYRTNLGDYASAAMDIEGDGGNIGYTNDGEWLMYTVDVRDEGNYEIDWYISVNGSGAACHVEVDGTSSDIYPMVNNSNWSDWRYYCERNGIAPPVYHLTPGKHTLKYVWNGGSYNYNGLRVTPKP